MSGVRGSNGSAVIVQLERLFRYGTATGSSEGELVERFVKGRDEAAFEAIVARYGPMVLRVCRQLLRDPNDVDDAFQVTFLILVRKASSLKRCDLLGNWLYGVAHRVALRTRNLAARRGQRTTAAIAAGRFRAMRLSPRETGNDRCEAQSLERDPSLHEEIARLPEKYRVPIVLCYMEGLTHDDAARQLKWPLGTVKGRLARARALLRRRLTHRGVTMSEATLTMALSGPHLSAIPNSLIESTVLAATSISRCANPSLAASSTISLSVSALEQGVLQAMMITKLKTIVLPLLVVSGVATGVVALAAQTSPDKKPAGAQAQTAEKPADRNSIPEAQPAVEPGPKTATQLLRDQLNADEELYQSLVVPGRVLSDDDFRGLVRWSLRLLDASRSLSADPPARKAAYAGHRERMKRLSALANKSSATDEIKRMTQAQLKEAEELLKSAPEAGPRPIAGVPSPANQAGVAAVEERQSSPSSAGGAGMRPIHSSQLQGVGDSSRGMMGSMAGAMGGMGGMTSRMSTEAENHRLRPQIAADAIELAVRNPDPRNQPIWKKLEEPVSMSFAAATPLEDILKYVKQATTSPTFAGIPIYVDPKGLEDTGATLNSTVSIDLEHVRLKTTLRLFLKQLGLAYCVRDGVLIISSVEGINEELLEERSELDAANVPLP